MLGVAAEIVAAVARGRAHVDARRLVVGEHANDDVVGKTQNQRAIGKLYESGRIFVLLRRQLE